MLQRPRAKRDVQRATACVRDGLRERVAGGDECADGAQVLRQAAVLQDEGQGVVLCQAGVLLLAVGAAVRVVARRLHLCSARRCA
jgi:hypothetical protein